MVSQGKPQRGGRSITTNTPNPPQDPPAPNEISKIISSVVTESIVEHVIEKPVIEESVIENTIKAKPIPLKDTAPIVKVKDSWIVTLIKKVLRRN